MLYYSYLDRYEEFGRPGIGLKRRTQYRDQLESTVRVPWISGI